MDSKTYERYSRQILFSEIGEAGQQCLLESSAVMVGCGALGTALANLLVRAGVGKLRIVDRDFVEPSNLQRQTLFEESDAQEALPKAVAAERRLRAINSGVAVEGIVADVSSKNAEELLSGFPLILDGTDNFETRFLLNDVAIHLNVPWIYAAVVASYGVTLTVRPGETACLACALESESADGGQKYGSEDTCDTIGVLGAAAGVIASIEAAEAIKLLTGKPGLAGGRLNSFDVWSGKFQSVRVARNADCRACVRHDFRYLEGEAQPHLTMCGRDSVQIHERRRQLDLSALGKRLEPTVAEVRENGFLLRFRVPPYEMTVFADGRAIIKGTQDPSIARSLYARYIGV
ncbi:MAG TPA: ThiF family adenylyltransferase [Candidatus Acidoferrales bacterium]|nr:ThiF family adenylyltransferase [Candidatus Acidoferrales bacterium]